MAKSEFVSHAENFGKISKIFKLLDLPLDVSSADLPAASLKKLSKFGTDASRVLAGYTVIKSLRLNMAFVALSAATGMSSAGYSAAARSLTTKETLTEIGPSSAVRAALHHVMDVCPEMVGGDYPFKKASIGQEYTLVHFAALACQTETQEAFIKSSLGPESLRLFVHRRTEIETIKETTNELYKKKVRIGKAIEAINKIYHDEAYLPATNGLIDFDEWAKSKGVLRDFNDLLRQSKLCDIPIEDIVQMSLNPS